jgi:hypothetical protein
VGSGNLASVDGTGVSAQFYYILKLTTDKAGNIYVLEAVISTDNNLFYKIRKVTPTGVTSTLHVAGYNVFVNNIPVQKAKIYSIQDMATDQSGNVYVIAYMTDYSTFQR